MPFVPPVRTALRPSQSCRWRQCGSGVAFLPQSALDNEGCTPILWAAMRENVATTQALLTAGADVTLGEDSADLSPLDMAASLGQVDVVRAMIGHGVDLHTAGSSTGGTALYHAASMGKPEVIDVLVEAGADVDVEQLGMATRPSMPLLAPPAPQPFSLC